MMQCSWSYHKERAFFLHTLDWPLVHSMDEIREKGAD
jgi:hypothetical protein